MPEQTTHTPGPWAVWELHPDIFAVGDSTVNTPGSISGARARIAACEPEDLWDCGTDDEAEVRAAANARLIAAAPELLGALTEIVAAWDCGPDGLDGVGRAIDEARGAIAKALPAGAVKGAVIDVHA